MEEQQTPKDRAWVDDGGAFDPNPYAAGTMVDEVIGNHSKVRILDFLVSESIFENPKLTAADICAGSGIGKTAFYENIDTLVHYGLITEVDQVGNTTRYQLNKDNKPAKKFSEFSAALVTQRADEEED